MAAEREAELVGAELCVRAREVGGKFRKPDDDWQGMCLVMSKGSFVGLFHVPVPPIALGGEARDAVFQGVVPTLIREYDGTAAAIVQSSWMVQHQTKEAAEQTAAFSRAGGSLEDVPGRTEALIVTACDSEGIVCWMATIARWHGRPPTLGKWELWEGQLDGRLVAGLQAALVG